MPKHSPVILEIILLEPIEPQRDWWGKVDLWDGEVKWQVRLGDAFGLRDLGRGLDSLMALREGRGQVLNVE